jgi:thiosulfate reductase cytochrome b subunit
MAGLEILLLGTYFFAVKGVLRRGVPGACLWLLFGVWLYFMAISGGALGGGRYRLPVMPIICIFAAAGIRIGGSPHTALHDDISRIGNG